MSSESDTLAHAIPIMLSMGMLITSLCLGAFAILAPDSSIRPFLIVLALVLAGVAIAKMFDVAWYESKIDKLRKELSNVDPDSCPDYWMTEFSRCNGQLCRPYFDGVNLEDERGSVRMVAATDDTFSLSLSEFKTKAPDSMCSTLTNPGNMQYPWMELSNQCQSRYKM